jgi:3-oxoadipate enol-lactonase
MEIQLPDFRMEYEDQGLGLPLLLIHGFPLDHTLWNPQVKELQKAARLLAPDLRGFGGSDPVLGTYTMDLLAKDCYDFLNNIGVKQPVIVGGLSMGGYVTFAFYRKYPERVLGLFLAATRAAPDSAEARAMRTKNVALAMECGSPAIAELMLPKLLSPITYTQKPHLVTAIREVMEGASVEGIVGALLGMRDRPDSTPILAQIDKPTLIIHGANDQLIPLKEAQAMQAAIRSSRLEVLPEAGHLLTLEQPQLFNKALQDFITSI